MHDNFKHSDNEVAGFSAVTADTLKNFYFLTKELAPVQAINREPKKRAAATRKLRSTQTSGTGLNKRTIVFLRYR